ncbi:MAG TPA: hypothetical protein VNB64_00100 [Solirubrobacteraceae bacterium]|nr:hypothetical protein [Solirubrobacteraceae bacterium]
MRGRAWIVAGAMVAGCGASEVAQGPPVITGQVLGDALALELRDALEEAGIFGTAVGERGGMCRGAGARWDCTVDVLINDRIRDRRVYVLRVRPDGCWVARQTGTDVGATGRPSRPGRPGVLRGCVK